MGVLGEDGEEAEEPIDDRRLNAERHAFLLRLGVWEVPPIEAFESRDPRNRDANFPWVGSTADRQRAEILAGGGWMFGLDGWSGERHNNVYLAEDFWFTWPLEELAERGPVGLATALQSRISVLRTTYHKRWFSARSVETPEEPTRPPGIAPPVVGTRAGCLCNCVTIGGLRVRSMGKGSRNWWSRLRHGGMQARPTGTGLRQSPYRFLRLCGPASGITDVLRLVGA